MMRALVAATVVLLAFAPAAALGQVPSGPAALSGSNFQGGDGNQDNAAPLVDWQRLQGDGRVVHNPDPNEQDSSFAGGTKLLEPGDWDLTTEAGGVNPSKVNIRDAWAAVDQPAADTFLYLAFTRETAEGTAAIVFELNHDGRLWNNGQAMIPCRTTGDLMVATLPHGNEVEIAVARWTTTTPDPATGCARTGTIEQLQTLPVGSVQGAVNAGTITSRLPGTYPPDSTIPAERFSEAALNLSSLMQIGFHNKCVAFTSIWMHSRSSLSETSNEQDYVAPQPLSVRTCSASGTKFLDLDADGVRDAGEPGIPRFLIWADYDNDGVRDANEPFAVTDKNGHYVIDDIRPPSDSYRLRETLGTPGRSSKEPTPWRCSYPSAGTSGGFADGPGGLFGCGWGPIVAAATPNATGRDFGDWLPAALTVEKELWPAGDPGRFDLIVNGVTVFPAAGDGDKITLFLAPGKYNVSESAVAGTDPALYTSSVSCGTVTRRRGAPRSGVSWDGLVLQAGGQASCTFVNKRAGVPGIALDKSGPALVEAGDTLRYTLDVTNPGDLPIPAGSVKVTDSKCDDPPSLTSKNQDTSPDTLDPGDKWTYACSHKTDEPGADCAITAVTNVATASGSVGGIDISDDGSITTTVDCPNVPPEPPIPPTPEPGPLPPVVPPLPGPLPSPVAPFLPPGPTPPDAGEGGIAGITASRTRCITRVAQVRLRGQRMSVAKVSVDGRRIGTRTLRLLQRQLTPLTRVFSPGRHVLRISVTFEEGSGTAPVTLTRTITVCGRAAQAPRVTG